MSWKETWEINSTRMWGTKERAGDVEDASSQVSGLNDRMD